METSYIGSSELRRVVRELREGGRYKYALLLMLGVSFALRIRDLLGLKWSDLYGTKGVKHRMMLRERKTQKFREITIPDKLKDFINDCYDEMERPDKNEYIFINNRKDKPMSIQNVNRRLKEIFDKYDVKYDENSNISSHLMRKTYGRNYFNKAEDKMAALLMLQEVFGHNDAKTTKRYLGITRDEISEVYKEAGEEFLG